MKSWLWLVFIFVFSLAFAGPIDELFSQFSQDSTAEEQKALIAKYLPQIQSLEDHRRLQSLWSYIDKDAMQEHYSRLASLNPDDPDYLYLNLRFADNSVQIQESKRLLAKYPEHYWLYRLFTVSRSEQIHEAEDTSVILASANDDIKLLQQGLNKYPDDAYLLITLFELHNAQSKTAEARNYLSRITDQQALVSIWSQLHDFAVANQDIDLIKSRLPIFVSGYISSGYIEPQDSLGVYHNQYLKFLGDIQDSQALAQFLAEQPYIADSADFAGVLPTVYAKVGNMDKAFEALDTHVQSGALTIHDLTDDGYASLQSDPRWQDLIGEAEQQWAAGKEDRRAEALKSRTTTPAPLWELEDAQGKLIKLSDLKGKVLILDFWATWCGPCRMAMPALDEWMKTSMPQGVEVFSVNVMEKDPQTAKDYFKEHPFRMTLLMGNPELQKAYNVEAIPQITVIDTMGRIAFNQVGFSPDLEEKLSFWTEALLKEQ
ncbi:MAG: TlpA disulfide reductase family protein [Candidatus Cloacimonetes bacterium]|jgi:thiol-disulfide isomerase/thioredoxin|nr:TlpA family protein disulfide reductase [Candidatus Cloacimonadota bacterium]MDY0336383.1 TlpA disulfide reductase family protein [Candidatus Cloacimonadaceae bacterium]MCK9333818.1 TlpA family protein disulfide reductase [Candidatus Cloacimonadota bacterium]MDD2543234.1 TlpA disulfide reductase family protein [Candidatus Cloacimonadota bacterium]MDD2682874.1 TlpA disulfide reductase family protein [Candidatus Cloacimonadota bacterium]